MNNKLRATYVLFLGIFLLLCFVAVAFQIRSPQIAKFDQSIVSTVQGWETPLLTSIMKLFTFIGSTKVVVVIAIIIIVFVYKVLHHRLEIAFFVIVLAGSAILNTILKLAFHRERPTLHRLIQETGFSFPSGHSMGAFALYAALSFLLWRHIRTQTGRCTTIIIAVIMILAIGVSRIYLGVHYPSDVIGGFLASGFWFAICVWYFQWYKEVRYPKNK